MLKLRPLALPALAALSLLTALPAPVLAKAPTAQEKLADARSAYKQGDWGEAVARYRYVFKLTKPETLPYVEAALELSSLFWERGEYGEAAKLANEALDGAKKLKLDGAVGRLLLTMGHIEMSTGKMASAHSTFKTCVQLTAEQKDVIFGALCQINLSHVRRAKGLPGMSDGQMKQAIAALRSGGQPLNAGTALAKTGELYERQGNLDGALMMLGEAERLFKQAGSVPASARNQLRIARVLQAQGKWSEARAKIDGALPALQKMNGRSALVMAYGMLGKQAQHSGDQAGAVSQYTRALGIARQSGSPQTIAQSHLALCEALSRPTPQQAALSHCKHAATRFDQLRIPELAARATITLAALEQRQGHLTEARTLYKKSIKTIEQQVAAPLRDLRALSMQHANLCQVEMDLKITGAVHTCREAIKRLEAVKPADADTTRAIAASHYAAGIAAEREKSLKAALEHLFQAAEQYEKKLSPPDMLRAADSTMRLGALYARAKNGEARAEEAFNRADTLLGKTQDARAASVRAQLHSQRAQLLMSQSRWAGARRDLEALLPLATAANDHHTVATTHNNLALVSLRQDDRLGAQKHLTAALEAVKKTPDTQLKKLIEDNLKQFKPAKNNK